MASTDYYDREASSYDETRGGAARARAASADRLPLLDGSVDVVTMVWLLHMLPTDVADAALVEAARVLRPGGHLVVTVDKSQAHGHDGAESDRSGRVRQAAGALGVEQVAATTFTGSSTWGSATGSDPVFPLVALRRGTGRVGDSG